MDKNEIVYETCILIVRHFRNLITHDGFGFHSRIFSHMLHPEKEFVFIGTSGEVTHETPIHPEHVVPCAVLISECRRLILENFSDSEIASLLQKHWKIAHITKQQAIKLDSAPLNLKSKMPPGWNFETGDTVVRLRAAGIELIN